MDIPIRSKITLASLLLATAPIAGAEVLAYDGFDYTVGANAWNGAGGAETGFAGSWATDDAWHVGGVQTGGGVANIVSGLTFGTYPVSGNAVELRAIRPNELLPVGGRAASFDSTGSYYTSHLFQVVSDTGLPGNSEMGISAGQLTGGSPSDIRILAGQGDIATWLEGTTVLLGEVPSFGVTYMNVTKFAFDGVDTTATTWILEAADYDAAVLDGSVTDAELTSGSFASGSVSGAGDFGITPGEFLKFATWSGGGHERTTIMDEMRVGETLEDVMAIRSGPFEITRIAVESGNVTLSWSSVENVIYAVRYSTDAIDWSADIDDAVSGDAGQTTIGFDLSEYGLTGVPSIFFRIETN